MYVYNFNHACTDCFQLGAILSMWNWPLKMYIYMSSTCDMIILYTMSSTCDMITLFTIYLWYDNFIYNVLVIWSCYIQCRVLVVLTFRFLSLQCLTNGVNSSLIFALRQLIMKSRDFLKLVLFSIIKRAQDHPGGHGSCPQLCRHHLHVQGIWLLLQWDGREQRKKK